MINFVISIPVLCRLYFVLNTKAYSKRSSFFPIHFCVCLCVCTTIGRLTGRCVFASILRYPPLHHSSPRQRQRRRQQPFLQAHFTTPAVTWRYIPFITKIWQSDAFRGDASAIPIYFCCYWAIIQLPSLALPIIFSQLLSCLFIASSSDACKACTSTLLSQ